MKLQSKELFETVRKEYPDFSAAEAIAFVQAEYLAQIAKNTESIDYVTKEHNELMKAYEEAKRVDSMIL